MCSKRKKKSVIKELRKFFKLDCCPQDLKGKLISLKNAVIPFRLYTSRTNKFHSQCYTPANGDRDQSFPIPQEVKPEISHWLTVLYQSSVKEIIMFRSYDYVLTTDASESGAGATLKKGNKVIKTWSFQWLTTQSNMSSNRWSNTRSLSYVRTTLETMPQKDSQLDWRAFSRILQCNRQPPQSSFRDESHPTSIRSNTDGSFHISPEPSNEQLLNNQNECTPPRLDNLVSDDSSSSSSSSSSPVSSSTWGILRSIDQTISRVNNNTNSTTLGTGLIKLVPDTTVPIPKAVESEMKYKPQVIEFNTPTELINVDDTNYTVNIFNNPKRLNSNKELINDEEDELLYTIKFDKETKNQSNVSLINKRLISKEIKNHVHKIKDKINFPFLDVKVEFVEQINIQVSNEIHTSFIKELDIIDFHFLIFFFICDDTNSQVYLVRNLTTYLRVSKERRKPHSGDSVFIQNEGKPFHFKEINIIVLSTLSSSGIDISKFKSHSTRSAMASLLLSNNVPLWLLYCCPITLRCRSANTWRWNLYPFTAF
ncbi:hypothetical protein ACTFIW_013341 [Dictyostelium discoideum]